MRILSLWACFTFAGFLSSCGNKSSDSTDLRAVETYKTRVNDLDRSCTVDADCRIVANDLACGKSFTVISAGAMAEYTQLKQQFDEEMGPIGCTQEWSDTYDPNNYEVLCSATNQCLIQYVPPVGAP